MKKLTLPAIILLVILFFVGCGNSDSLEFKEPAKGITISPDPAFLNQPLTIKIKITTVVQSFLEYVIIKDAAGSVVKEFRSSNPTLELPDGVTVSSGNWIINETFTSGSPGRWTLDGEYQSVLGMMESKSFSGSFSMNKGTTSTQKITGNAVNLPSNTNQDKESKVITLVKTGSNSMASGILKFSLYTGQKFSVSFQGIDSSIMLAIKPPNSDNLYGYIGNDNFQNYRTGTPMKSGSFTYNAKEDGDYSLIIFCADTQLTKARCEIEYEIK